MDLSGRCVGSSYVLQHPIGQGATGTVWRGLDRSTGEPVAVKLLHESLLRQPKLVTRFVQERTILLMLRHRNVVRVRDLFSVGETLGLVMDLVDGGSLRDHLRENGTVAAGEACRLAAQVAAALAEAHELGVIHRDLKPDNILLRVEGGRLDTRLTDFGVARILNTPSMTTPNAVVGTPHYMAPEAFHGTTASAATDVYALGVLLYELVSGRPPYDSDSIPDLMRRHMEGHPVRRSGIPDDVWHLIEDCMAGKPRLRPSAAEMVAALSDAAKAFLGTPPLPRPEGVYTDPGSAYADDSAFYPNGLANANSNASWPGDRNGAGHARDGAGHGRDGAGRDGAGRDGAGRDGAGRGWDGPGRQRSRADRERDGERHARDSADLEPTRRARAGGLDGNGRAYVGNGENGRSGLDQSAAGRSDAGRSDAGRSSAGRSDAGRSSAGRSDGGSGRGGVLGTGGRPGLGADLDPEAVSLLPVPRKPERGNAAPSWRWAKRPGATMTIIAGAMVATAVATTAWNVGRAGDQPRDGVTTQVLAAPTGSSRPSLGVVRSAPSRKVAAHNVAPTGHEQQGSDAARLVTPRSVPSKSAAPGVTESRSPQPEAQPYGPWECRQSFAIDMSGRTAFGPKPCQMLGRDIQYQASLTAPGGGTGSITVALQDASNGRTVAGPKTCDNLAFGGNAATRACGPSGASPSRGHKYTVVMTYRYERQGRTVASSSKGSVFAW
jgi:serine/threonine-protein kinase